MARPRKRDGRYQISVVAKRFKLHPQTLRLYEREGLLKPSRTEGNLFGSGNIRNGLMAV